MYLAAYYTEVGDRDSALGVLRESFNLAFKMLSDDTEDNDAAALWDLGCIFTHLNDDRNARAAFSALLPRLTPLEAIRYLLPSEIKFENELKSVVEEVIGEDQGVESSIQSLLNALKGGLPDTSGDPIKNPQHDQQEAEINNGNDEAARYPPLADGGTATAATEHSRPATAAPESAAVSLTDRIAVEMSGARVQAYLTIQKALEPFSRQTISQPLDHL